MRRRALAVLFLLQSLSLAHPKTTSTHRSIPPPMTPSDNPMSSSRIFSPGPQTSSNFSHSSPASPSAVNTPVTNTPTLSPITTPTTSNSTSPSMDPPADSSEAPTPASSSPFLSSVSNPSTSTDGSPPTSTLPPSPASATTTSAPSSSTSTPGSPPKSPNSLASTKSNKASSIAAGVVVPIVALALAAAGLVLYRRRRRTRDRLEWERTHKEIADAVRKAGAAGTTGSAASGSGWSRMELVSRPASGTDGVSVRGVLGGDSSLDRPFSDYAAPPLPASWRGPEYSAAADGSPPESPEPGFYRDEPEPEPDPVSRAASPTGSGVHVDSSIGHHASAL